MKELIELEHVSLAFRGATVLSNMDMTIREGERLAVMGPSGSGKTSLLRLIAGLIKPTAGKIIRHTDRIAVQFQEARLLPTRTAAENVNAVLSDGAKTMPEARAWLARVGLDPAADLYPDELSGGMAQRVALARALAYGGDLLLLDEPFRGLDDKRKVEMMDTVLSCTTHTAILLVTHDRAEAEYMGMPITELTFDKRSDKQSTTGDRRS